MTLLFYVQGRFGPKPEKSKNVISSVSSGGSCPHHYNKNSQELKTKPKEHIQERFNTLLHLIINWKRKMK